MFKRNAYLIYGVACYVMFLGVFAWLAAFLANAIVPRSVDRAVGGSPVSAMVIDLALLALFGIQHSVMARPTFKQWWTRIVPQPIERSTYVLLTNLVLIVLYWQWRAIDLVLWETAGAGRVVMWLSFAAGWMLVLTSTLLLNHFELFGLRQVWLQWRGREYTHLPFKTPLFYRHVRHPLYVGWLMVFWMAPTMTVGRLLFAGGMSTYILIAIYFEERNLVAFLGKAYADYRRRVPMLLPSFRRTTSADDTRRSPRELARS